MANHVLVAMQNETASGNHVRVSLAAIPNASVENANDARVHCRFVPVLRIGNAVICFENVDDPESQNACDQYRRKDCESVSHSENDYDVYK